MNIVDNTSRHIEILCDLRHKKCLIEDLASLMYLTRCNRHRVKKLPSFIVILAPVNVVNSLFIVIYKNILYANFGLTALSKIRFSCPP
jgi:hypothetical protein